MPSVEDFVARIEGACGAEKDVIVVFKFDKKEEALANIFKRAQLKRSIAGIIHEMTFKDHTFRVYSSGKAIFRSIKNKEELNELLSELLLPDENGVCSFRAHSFR
jgi:ArsR family metal-binding transcriptional regulator